MVVKLTNPSPWLTFFEYGFDFTELFESKFRIFESAVSMICRTLEPSCMYLTIYSREIVFNSACCTCRQWAQAGKSWMQFKERNYFASQLSQSRKLYKWLYTVRKLRFWYAEMTWKCRDRTVNFTFVNIYIFFQGTALVDEHLYVKLKVKKFNIVLCVYLIVKYFWIWI